MSDFSRYAGRSPEADIDAEDCFAGGAESVLKFAEKVWFKPAGGARPLANGWVKCLRRVVGTFYPVDRKSVRGRKTLQLGVTPGCVWRTD